MPVTDGANSSAPGTSARCDASALMRKPSSGHGDAEPRAPHARAAEVVVARVAGAVTKHEARRERPLVVAVDAADVSGAVADGADALPRCRRHSAACCRTGPARRRGSPTRSTYRNRRRSRTTGRPASSRPASTTPRRPPACSPTRTPRCAGRVRCENLAGPIERLDRHQVDLARQRQIAEERDRHQRALDARLNHRGSSARPFAAHTASVAASFRMLRGRCRSRHAVSPSLASSRLRSLVGLAAGWSRDGRVRLRRVEPKPGQLRHLHGRRLGHRLGIDATGALGALARAESRERKLSRW